MNMINPRVHGLTSPSRCDRVLRVHTRFWLVLGAAWLLSSHAMAGGNANRGKALFKERCSVCHSAEPDDGGGAQGPSLINLMGRPAASSPQF